MSRLMIYAVKPRKYLCHVIKITFGYLFVYEKTCLFGKALPFRNLCNYLTFLLVNLNLMAMPVSIHLSICLSVHVHVYMSSSICTSQSTCLLGPPRLTLHMCYSHLLGLCIHMHFIASSVKFHLQMAIHMRTVYR